MAAIVMLAKNVNRAITGIQSMTPICLLINTLNNVGTPVRNSIPENTKKPLTLLSIANNSTCENTRTPAVLAESTKSCPVNDMTIIAK
jgi:hypothetical protein